MTVPVMQCTATEYRRRICQAINFISQNLDRDLPLEEIARAASFSSFHFHRIFKAVVGETVAEFTRRLRLELAANRLIADEESITVIAFDCGFSSSQNFAKAFRQHFQLTPSAYRKSKQGNKNSKQQNALSLQADYDADTVFENLLKIERRKDMNAEVKEMPEYHVAYVRKIGPYGRKTSLEAFGELMRWAEPKGYLKSEKMLGVYWDNPEVTPPGRCRTDACITLPQGKSPDGRIGTQKISHGPYLVCHFEIKPDDFPKAWEEAFVTLISRGYQCADLPCYELYSSNSECSGNKWIFDICIPLKSKK